jgi:tight adherence protein C
MPLYVIMTLLFTGAALSLLVLSYALLPGKTVLEERLLGFIPKPEEPSFLGKKPTSWQKFLGRLGGGIPLRPQDYGKYTRNLVAAGMRREMLPVFMGAKVSLIVILPVSYVLLYGIPTGQERMAMVIVSAALAIVGFLMPSYWLLRTVRKRKLRIFHDLPDVLDLLTVCVEAGLSMDAAIIRISEDKQFRHSPLARELKIATQETRAGKPRSEALRDMGERTMLDDLRSFVSMLIQTEQLGTSLAQSLRIHSDSLRTMRRQKAEEAAAKTAVKLLFPLIFLIMPAIFVVMLMPALLRLVKFFSEM